MTFRTIIQPSDDMILYFKMALSDQDFRLAFVKNENYLFAGLIINDTDVPWLLEYENVNYYSIFHYYGPNFQTIDIIPYPTHIAYREIEYCEDNIQLFHQYKNVSDIMTRIRRRGLLY